MLKVDCIVCGTCVADILVRPVILSEPPGAGRLFHVEPIDVAVGGIVCNSGTALRRLGMRVAASSLVGNDLWSSVVRSRLEAEGIVFDALGRTELSNSRWRPEGLPAGDVTGG